MPRRARAKTAILSVRLLPDEKKYLTLAAEREADEIAKLIQGVPMTISSFVRWAALQKAEQRLGLTLAEFTSGKKAGKKRRRA
ncbi:MAG TPA: hypothetical protein VN914_01075 [Polyangia bacterium]|jgi:uncharacterized protein (DUF1778 family)|nr:hypothetical protein [Polyangia bacterium]